MGSTVIDSWKVFKNNHRDGGKPPSVAEFADIMVHEMLVYATNLQEDEGTCPFVRLEVLHPTVVTQESPGSQVSMMTEINTKCHTRLIYQETNNFSAFGAAAYISSNIK